MGLQVEHNCPLAITRLGITHTVTMNDRGRLYPTAVTNYSHEICESHQIFEKSRNSPRAPVSQHQKMNIFRTCTSGRHEFQFLHLKQASMIYAQLKYHAHCPGAQTEPIDKDGPNPSSPGPRLIGHKRESWKNAKLPAAGMLCLSYISLTQTNAGRRAECTSYDSWFHYSLTYCLNHRTVPTPARPPHPTQNSKSTKKSRFTFRFVIREKATISAQFTQLLVNVAVGNMNRFEKYDSIVYLPPTTSRRIGIAHKNTAYTFSFKHSPLWPTARRSFPLQRFFKTCRSDRAGFT